MAAASIDLELEQGSTFRHEIQWLQSDGINPVNITGCTARSQWRTDIKSTDPVASLNTENGKIVIDPTKGKFTLKLTAQETADFNFDAAVYDLEVVYPPDASGEVVVYKIAKGKVKVIKEITR